MPSIITNEDLYRTSSSVWESILGIDLSLDDGSNKEPHTDLVACVQIAGDWDGAVTIACKKELAKELASAMFATPVEELSEDEVLDAMGEIANMTGGNVKAVTPGSNTLSLPTVTSGNEHALRVGHSVELNRIITTCLNQPVVITIFGKES